jgi:hypothetical protein
METKSATFRAAFEKVGNTIGVFFNDIGPF